MVIGVFNIAGALAWQGSYFFNFHVKDMSYREMVNGHIPTFDLNCKALKGREPRVPTEINETQALYTKNVPFKKQDN